jgi:hypothetical protein
MTRRMLMLALLAGASTGCYWSSPPSTPHRSTKLELANVPALGAPSPRPMASKRLVVLGRFDTSAPQPIGGLYDKKDYSVSPLIRTYFYKDGAVELFEHVSDGLRAAGLFVLKDYAGHAEPALLEPPLRARDPLLVTGTVLALQHDQIREKTDDGSAEWEAGRFELAVRVSDEKGAVRLSKTFLVEGRIPFDDRTELLKLLGWTMAERLSNDPEFVKAVEGGAS